jgi:hypothetical protein
MDMGKVNMEHRRRVPRQLAGWRGLCLIAGESAIGWHDCRVIDISTLGLGLMLHHPRPTELAGRGLSVDSHSMTQSRSDSKARSGARQHLSPETPSGWDRILESLRTAAGNGCRYKHVALIPRSGLGPGNKRPSSCPGRHIDQRSTQVAHSPARLRV